jgi:hypothetical protein
MGIDGYWFLTREPIQVKQQDHVGRETVDKFETALRRVKYDSGFIIGFGFTKDAVEEVARVKREEGVTIKLIKVAQLLLEIKRPQGKFGPQPGSVEELPFPSKRKKKDLPTPEELIESDQRTGTDETPARKVAAQKTGRKRSIRRRP